MNVAEAFKMLEEELGAHGLVTSGWKGELDRARRRFGVCRMSDRVISLSRVLVELNSEDEVRDTILHEIAHALAWERYRENCGHDARWKEICVEIGARPERCYDEGVVQPDLPWALCHVETGEVFATYARKPSRDVSRLWLRGRKAETFGKLRYCRNPKLDGDEEVAPSGGFTQSAVSDLLDEVMEAARAIAQRRGMEVSREKADFTVEEFRLGLKFRTEDVDGVGVEERDFIKNAVIFDLPEGAYKRWFSSQGEMFQLVALKPRNRKYPVIGLSKKGRRYKFSREVLERLQ